MAIRNHHPPHLFADESWCLITASTHDRTPILAEIGAKIAVRDSIRDLAASFGIDLRAWVILDNHYHLLLRSEAGTQIPRFVRQLHGRTARQINDARGIAGRQVWHNYWDTGVRGEGDSWTKFNYIHQNPLKHGYVERIEDWPFSSYHYYLRTKGSDWLADCFARYPVVGFLHNDEF